MLGQRDQPHGKPVSHDHGLHRICRASGRGHRVLSGVTLQQPGLGLSGNLPDRLPVTAVRPAVDISTDTDNAGAVPADGQVPAVVPELRHVACAAAEVIVMQQHPGFIRCRGRGSPDSVDVDLVLRVRRGRELPGIELIFPTVGGACREQDHSQPEPPPHHRSWKHDCVPLWNRTTPLRALLCGVVGLSVVFQIFRNTETGGHYTTQTDSQAAFPFD